MQTLRAITGIKYNQAWLGCMADKYKTMTQARSESSQDVVCMHCSIGPVKLLPVHAWEAKCKLSHKRATQLLLCQELQEEERKEKQSYTVRRHNKSL